MSQGRRTIYGIGPVRELLAARPEAVLGLLVSPARDRKGDPVSALGERARDLGIKVDSARPHELEAACGSPTHQGVVAFARELRPIDLDELMKQAEASPRQALVVALDGVTDPHNLGAIARSAYLFGAHGLVVPVDRSAALSPVAVKASAGALEHLAVAQVVNLARALDDLKQAGLWIAALAAGAGARPIHELDGTMPLCLVLGAEGKGVRPLTRKQADFLCEIPMQARAIGSFNVSVAGGIALYEVCRQREAKHGE